MTAVTVSLALLFSLVAFTRKSQGAAVGVLIFSMIVWPEYLRFPLLAFDSSIPRFLALLLLANAVFKGKFRTAAKCDVDRIVLGIWIWIFVAAVVTGAPFEHISQMIGRGLDTVLMYFVVRAYIQSADDFKQMAWWLALAILVMAPLGIGEAVTGKSPYSGMTDMRGWHWIEKDNEYRLGLLRARASTSVHIYFGLAMMLITGIYWSAYNGLQQSRLGKLIILLGVLGALSSMSSGPWLACALMFALGLYRYRPDLIKPSLWMLLLASLVLELASNRHFYNLIDYLALDSHTAWYRTKLMEVAFSRLEEFWFLGVGANWPHHWGALLDGRQHIDVVNQFLIVALYGGLPAAYLYILSHWRAIAKVVRLWKAPGKNEKVLAFHLAAMLVALDISSLSVGLFGPPLLLSHILLALIVSVTQFPVLTPNHYDQVTNAALPSRS